MGYNQRHQEKDGSKHEETDLGRHFIAGCVALLVRGPNARVRNYIRPRRARGTPAALCYARGTRAHFFCAYSGAW